MNKISMRGDAKIDRQLSSLRFLGVASVLGVAFCMGEVRSETDPGVVHWSFQPLVEHALPTVSAHVSANQIDRWVLAKLDEVGITPSAMAPRPTLLRRLSLVMLGLPPSPLQVARFVKDGRPDAWERVVDHTLARPEYGERWAQHWIDVTGWGETDGYEGNESRSHAWPYRDYVIEAWNSDKPYDDFVREQIAGDALGNPRATGFLVAGPVDRVKSPNRALTLNQRQDELARIIDTTGTAFMGMTIGCARCHTHKFDPITHYDYYAIQAVFAGVQHPSGAGAAEAPPYLSEFVQPGPTHVLVRGDPFLPEELVSPGAILSLAGFAMKAGVAEQTRRLRFARWLTRMDHPLTWRVIVNRLWQHHFGQGLVATPSDLGANGALPTHPRLLDRLALELVRAGGSVKHVQRQILQTQVFRRSHASQDRALAVDADTRLLWRYPPHRLDAEAIHDSMLFVSGVLDSEMGGPGYLGFDLQIKVDREFLPKESYTAEDWRRMVYMTKVRQEREPTFGMFDCPAATHPVGQRSRSTTPLQALNLANSRFVMQQSELLAERLEAAFPDSRERQITLAFKLALLRPPTTLEIEETRQFVGQFGLVLLCRALFNSNEFVFLL